MITISVSRKAYNHLKKRGEVQLQDIMVPSTLRAKHNAELTFPSRHGKRVMTIPVKVLARVKMDHHSSGFCHLTVKK